MNLPSAQCRRETTPHRRSSGRAGKLPARCFVSRDSSWESRVQFHLLERDVKNDRAHATQSRSLVHPPRTDRGCSASSHALGYRGPRRNAQGTRRRRVALLPGCVQRVYFAEVNRATQRVLTAEGCDVSVPRGLGCCGALSLHAGRESEAQRFARRAIAVLEIEDVDVILGRSPASVATWG